MVQRFTFPLYWSATQVFRYTLKFSIIIFYKLETKTWEKKRIFFFNWELGSKAFALTQVLSLACDINPKLYKLRPNQAEIPARFLLFLFQIGRSHDLNISKLTKCGVGLWWQFWGAWTCDNEVDRLCWRHLKNYRAIDYWDVQFVVIITIIFKKKKLA